MFFSADPEAVDHEIALINGRTSLEDPHWIQQISMRVDSLDDLRDFKRRIQAHGYQLDRIVTHASAIGCYFRDPENNPTEVFWLTGYQSWAQIGIPIDIDQSDEEVWQKCFGPGRRPKTSKWAKYPARKRSTPSAN